MPIFKKFSLTPHLPNTPWPSQKSSATKQAVPKRKESLFTPPPAFNKETTPAIKPALSTSAFKRQFSNEDTPVPIPVNTSADDLIYIDTLSTSSLADVVRVQRKDTKDIIAAKAFKHSSWRGEYLCHAELRVLQNVNSPWLVTFYGYLQDLLEDFLLFEYLPNGNLLALLYSHCLTECQLQFYAAEMFLAVDSLHQHGIMHRNVQLSNFLIHTSGHLRIIGFGLTYHFKDSSNGAQAENYMITEGRQPMKENTEKFKARGFRNSFMGKYKQVLPRITNPVFASPEKTLVVASTTSEGKKTIMESSTTYMAPEVLRLMMPQPAFHLSLPKLGYSYLCDYWSLGVALYRMLFGYYPFIADSKGMIADKVLNFRKSLTFPLSCPSLTCKHLVKELLKKESKRLGRCSGFAEVKEHDFFRGLRWDQVGHGTVAMPVHKSDLSRYISTVAPDPQSTMESSLSVPAISDTPQPQFAESTLSICTSQSSDESSDDHHQISQVVDTLSVHLELPVCSDPSVDFFDRSAIPGKGSNITEHSGASGTSRTGTSVSTLASRQLDTSRSKTFLQKLTGFFDGPRFRLGFVPLSTDSSLESILSEASCPEKEK